MIYHEIICDRYDLPLQYKTRSVCTGISIYPRKFSRRMHHAVGVEGAARVRAFYVLQHGVVLRRQPLASHRLVRSSRMLHLLRLRRFGLLRGRGVVGAGAAPRHAVAHRRLRVVALRGPLGHERRRRRNGREQHNECVAAFCFCGRGVGRISATQSSLWCVCAEFFSFENSFSFARCETIENCILQWRGGGEPPAPFPPAWVRRSRAW
jgi:hypothetical protein